MASEWADVNGTTGQAELLLPVDVLNEEQPERYLCVHVHRMVYQLRYYRMSRSTLFHYRMHTS